MPRTKDRLTDADVEQIRARARGNQRKQPKYTITDATTLPYMLSREDVANLANVDPRTVVTWLKYKQVPGAFKQGGKWLINRDVLLAAWSGASPKGKRKQAVKAKAKPVEVNGNGAAKESEPQAVEEIVGFEI